LEQGKRIEEKQERKQVFSPCDRAWVKSICLAGKENKKENFQGFHFLICSPVGVYRQTPALQHEWMGATHKRSTNNRTVFLFLFSLITLACFTNG
jgi:hypothetical protein